MAHRSQPIDINRCGGEGVNKMKVQKCWKWTYKILVGGGEGVNKMKVQKCLEMDLQYFCGRRGLTKQKSKNARNGLTIFWPGGGDGGAIILVQNRYFSQCKFHDVEHRVGFVCRRATSSKK